MSKAQRGPSSRWISGEEGSRACRAPEAQGRRTGQMGQEAGCRSEAGPGGIEESGVHAEHTGSMEIFKQIKRDETCICGRLLMPSVLI